MSTSDSGASGANGSTQPGGSRRGRTVGPAMRTSASSGSPFSARLAAAAAAGASETNAANQPTIFGLLAGKRLAKQFANRVYARRGRTSDSDPAGELGGSEPTYRMEPQRKFNVKQVEAALKEIVDMRMEGFRYSGKIAPMLSKVLSEEIKEAVKEINFDRYKVVCLVTIGEKKNQNLRVTSRCTWDMKTDNSATYSWQNMTQFCSVTVYGLYHE